MASEDNKLPTHLRTKHVHSLTLYHTTQAGAVPGPQQFMFDQALQVPTPYFVVLESENPRDQTKLWKSYGFAASAQDMHDFMREALKDNYGVYELIPPGQPCRGALDVEWYQKADPGDMKPKDNQGIIVKALRQSEEIQDRPQENDNPDGHDKLQSILDAYAAMLLELGVPDDKIVFAIGRNGRWVTKKNKVRYKHSYHVVAPYVYFSSWERHQRAVCLELSKRLTKPEVLVRKTNPMDLSEESVDIRQANERIGKAVDISIYTMNRLYRIIGSRKPPNNDPLELVMATLGPRCMANPRWFWDTSITLALGADSVVIEDSAIMDNYLSLLPTTVQTRSLTRAPRAERNNPIGLIDEQLQLALPVPATTAEQFVAQLQLLINQKKIEGTVYRSNKPGQYPCRKKPGVRKCAFGETHDSNNFFLLVVPSFTDASVRVSYACHSEKCRGKLLHLGNISLPDALGMEICTQRGCIINKRTIKMDSVQFCAPKVSDSPEFKCCFSTSYGPCPWGEKKCILLKSPMGSGKTVCVKKILESWVRKQKKLRVLFVGTRRAFDEGIYHEFKDLGFQLYGKLTMDENLLIVQWESLHKVDTPYNMIVLDELESLASNVYSPTNKQHMVGNYEKFASLLRRAEIILGLDAQLSDKGISLLQTAINVKDMVHFENTFVPPSRQVRIYSVTDRNKSNDKAMNSWFSVMEKTLDTGKGVGVFSGSKEFLCDYVKPFVEAYGLAKEDIMLFVATQDDEKKKSIGRINDIVESKMGAFALLCSPTVTVGTNIDVEDKFGAVFLYGTPYSVCAAVLMQMAGRVRHPIDSTIHLVIEEQSLMMANKRWPNPQNVEYVKECIKNRVDVWRKLTDAYGVPILDLAVKGDFDVDGTYALKLMNPELLHAYAHSLYEDLASKHDFLGQFKQLVWSKGWTCKNYDQDASDGPEQVCVTMTSANFVLKKDTKIQDENAAYMAAPILDPGELHDHDVKISDNKATQADRVAMDKTKLYTTYGLQTLVASKAIHNYEKQLNTVYHAMHANGNGEITNPNYIQDQYFETAKVPYAVKTHMIRQVTAMVNLDLSATKLKQDSFEEQVVDFKARDVDAIYNWCAIVENWRNFGGAFPNVPKPPNRIVMEKKYMDDLRQALAVHDISREVAARPTATMKELQEMEINLKKQGLIETKIKYMDPVKDLRTWLSRILRLWGALSIKRVGGFGKKTKGIYRLQFKVIVIEDNAPLTIRQLALKRIDIRQQLLNKTQ